MLGQEQALFDQLLEKLGNTENASEQKVRFLSELCGRLAVLKKSYAECMQLNHEMLEPSNTQLNLPYWDAEREAFMLEIEGELIEFWKPPRNDENAPVKAELLTQAISLVPGEIAKISDESREISELEFTLATKLEAFYEHASRWWMTFEKEICERNKPRFIGIMMVRNKLITHPDKTFPDGYLNSISARSDAGPVLKNVRHQNQTDKFQDSGLTNNLKEMLESALKSIS